MTYKNCYNKEMESCVIKTSYSLYIIFLGTVLPILIVIVVGTVNMLISSLSSQVHIYYNIYICKFQFFIKIIMWKRCFYFVNIC